MRTTLTLDDDVASVLERLRKSRGASLKQLINEALRRRLKDMTGRAKRREPVRTRSVALGRLRISGIDNIAEALTAVSRPLPADDPRQRQPDIAKARQLLGWTPRTPLKEGLVRTIAYFESLLQEDGVRAMVGGKK
jgi:nucleoside-diphosphate-sugar epimerase